MKKKVFRSVLLASVITMVLTVCVVISVVYANSEESLKKEVRSEAVFVSEAINAIGSDYGDYVASIGRSTGNRITLVSPDGTVLYDNYASASEMDNHLSRPEIASALSDGTGEATRSSETLGEKIFYRAVKLENGNVLRVAATTKNALGILGNAAVMSFFLVIYILIIGLLIANILTRSIAKPLTDIDLDTPLENSTYEELSPLLTALDKRNLNIRKQVEKLSEQRREFDYITSNMSEGLVIFGANGSVLTANESAVKILGGDENGSYQALCRDSTYISAVESALIGKPFTAETVLSGRIYRLNSNPVKRQTDRGLYAAVLFIVDVTEREQAEALRREFSANVSHELKTPLTSIMGCAELIGNGLAKPEDIPRFADRIHGEASRLLTLIEDIIRLSRLDEEDLRTEFEPVELSEICRAVIGELSAKAEKNDISLSFEGDGGMISGFRPVLHEMIFNLCDNAITYNKPHRCVDITLKSENDRVTVTVADNGIGIGKEHQSRVFERFYRVDKSRSKETGGTGLGLSIVKHGALLHNAEVSLESEKGVGTTVTLAFPKI